MAERISHTESTEITEKFKMSRRKSRNGRKNKSHRNHRNHRNFKFFEFMNNEKKDPIVEELSKGGEAASVSPVLVKLDKYRIMSDTEVPSEEFLLRLFGKPCFPRRDLTGITGTEKCGKTFFTSMLMACAAAQEKVLELERIAEEPLKVMWYDTEQSLASTKGILTERVYQLVHTERECHTDLTDPTDSKSPAEIAESAERVSPAERTEMTESSPSGITARSKISAISAISAGPYKTSAGEAFDLDEKFFVFNVRACSYEERMKYLVAGIEAYKPDMVIVDNVCDLIPNINEAEECIKLIDQLMQLAAVNNCNISVVIHLNRSGEKRGLRGWLGTEILHKAFEVYYCEQIENTDVLSVEQNLTRKYKIEEKLYYKVNDDGLPEVTVRPNYQPRDTNGQYKTNKPEPYQIKSEKADTFNQDYIIRNDSNAKMPWEWNLKKLFTDAMGDRAEMGMEDLRKSVMTLSGIQQPKYYEKVFKLAIDMRVVQTTMDKYGRIVVIPIS